MSMVTTETFPRPPIANLLNARAMREQAEQQEAFACEEKRLTPEGRLRFWRIAAALRMAAMVIEDNEHVSGGYLAALEREMRRE